MKIIIFFIYQHMIWFYIIIYQVLLIKKLKYPIFVVVLDMKYGIMKLEYIMMIY